MKFIIIREELLNNIYQLNTISNNNNLNIYNNILIKIKNNKLIIINANQDMEIISKINLYKENKDGEITVSSRNFINIFKNLSENSEIIVKLFKDLIILKSNKSKFCLSTLPATNFPNIDKWIIKTKLEFNLKQSILKKIFKSVYFSVSNNDIRYTLTGILFKTEGNMIQCIASDGHRISISTLYIKENLPFCSIIIPKKSIIEIGNLLKEGDIKLKIGENNIRIYIKNLIFTSKLINGIYPNYQNLLLDNYGESFEINSDIIRESIKRVSVLMSEKFNIIYLTINNNNLKLKTKKPPKEEAEENVKIIYNGKKIKIGINLNYILPILNFIKKKKIKILIKKSDNSIQITTIEKNIKYLYIIMPVLI